MEFLIIGWQNQILYLTVALVLSTTIGFERQLRSKSAGMRTHALVGVGAALFMVISKYGFYDVVLTDLIRLDPSRVAAQVVSGIGFIGAGLVFVRRNKVRGLTTAASIWLVAAIGSAAGAGLLIPAVFVSLCHFLVVFFYPFLVGRTKLGRLNEHTLQVQYSDGTGALRRILQTCTEMGFAVLGFTTSERRNVLEASSSLGKRLGGEESGRSDSEAEREGVIVEVELEIDGSTPIGLLVQRLSDLDDVRGITVDDQPE